jgi:hypothetical protein
VPSSLAEADLPQCQKQLEACAYAVHALAMGAALLPDLRVRSACAERVETILRVFFVDEETRYMPAVPAAHT